MKKILVMLLFLLVVPTYVLGGQSYISDNKIHKKWLSYILNGSNGSRVRISTNNNNLHFAVDFLYNGLAISLACPAQASNTAKNLNINVNILIDDNYEMQTSAACFVENGFLYMNLDIPNMDFINQLARGKEVAFTL